MQEVKLLFLIIRRQVNKEGWECIELTLHQLPFKYSLFLQT